MYGRPPLTFLLHSVGSLRVIYIDLGSKRVMIIIMMRIIIIISTWGQNAKSPDHSQCVLQSEMASRHHLLNFYSIYL